LRWKVALLGQEQILCELLGEGRTTLRHAAMQDVGDSGPQDAPGIDAEMRIEAAVFDRDEGLWQIGRQILQRDIGAGHLAAIGEHAAVGARDLDGRRPFRDFKRLDRRQMRADPDDEANHGNRAPEAEQPRPNRTADRSTIRRAASNRRLAALRVARGLRSGGGSSSSSSIFRLADFFGLSSPPPGIRSSGDSRKSAAARPNAGSLRPPLFFRPHAIRQTPAPAPARR